MGLAYIEGNGSQHLGVLFEALIVRAFLDPLRLGRHLTKRGGRQ